MTNNKLLTRIKKLEALTERLEQSIQDIREDMELKEDDTIYCSEPYGDELPEEPDCEDGCPSCSHPEIEEELPPEETIDHDD